MTPVKLSGIGIGDNDIEYSFGSPKDIYPIKTAEDIKQYLGYAFFGNETLYKGELKFEFECDGDDYVIERDFAKNTVKVTVNGKEIAKNEIDEKLRDILRLSEGQWSEFVLASKHKEYEAAKENVRTFTDGIFDELKLNKDFAEKSAEEYRKEIESIVNKIEVLNWITEDDVDLEEKVLTIGDEIRDMEVDAARLGEVIGMGNTAKSAVERKAEVRTLLSRVEANDAKIAENKERLEKSKAIKEHFAVAKSLEEARAEVKRVTEESEEKEEKLVKLDAEIQTGTKVIKKKESEFLEANARVKALNEAFDEMIKSNKEEGKGDAYVLEQINAFCKEGDETLKELLKLKEEFDEDKKRINENIEKDERELGEIRKSADYKKAVREGACFEISLEEKKASLEYLKKAVEEDEKTVAALREERLRQEAALAVCRGEFARMFGMTKKSKKETLHELIDNYNELEMIKQSLYRNQILSATLLQDINAIDKKIGENTDMKRNCLENKQALENAKETLVAYMAKCDRAIAEKKEALNDVTALKKFYEDIDSLSYGSRCPVCSAPITQKDDAEKAAADLVSQEKELNAEVERLEGIKREYTDKLNSINLRLGSFESTIASSTGYIESLKQTKLAKLTALKNIYRENRVKNHEELTADLERAIEELAKFNAVITDVKSIVLVEENSEIALSRINERLDDLEKGLIPERNARISKLNAEIERYEEEKVALERPLNDTAALDLLEDTIKDELREEALVYELGRLYKEKKEVEGKLDELANDISVYDGRKYTFKKGEKEFDYTSLCLNVAAEQYDQVVNEIRRSEEDRQKIQDEYVAISRMIKERQEEADAIREELAEANKIKEVKLAYIDTLTESESGAATAFAGKSFDSVKSDVLTDDEEEAMAKEIAEHDEEILKYNCEMAALDEIITEAQDAYEGLDTNVAAAAELNQILHERMEEYVKISNKYNLAKTVKDTVNDLERAHADARKRLNDVTMVVDGHASDLIVAKTNNALNVLMPRIRVKLKEDGLTVISTGKSGIDKELDKIEDDEYICVCISIINAVKQVVSEVINSSATIRVIRIRAGLVKDDTREKLMEFAKNNDLILIFHK